MQRLQRLLQGLFLAIAFVLRVRQERLNEGFLTDGAKEKVVSGTLYRSRLLACVLVRLLLVYPSTLFFDALNEIIQGYFFYRACPLACTPAAPRSTHAMLLNSALVRHGLLELLRLEPAVVVAGKLLHGLEEACCAAVDCLHLSVHIRDL